MSSNCTDWHNKPLASVADLVMGQSPESKYYSVEEKGLPFLQGCAEFQARFPEHVQCCTQIKKIVPKGAILFSVRAPVGKINIADQEYIIGRGIAGIIGIEIDQEYLEHYLKFEEQKFQRASQGSTFEAINSSELSSWPVTYPSYKPEQTKIAKILSTVDQAIEQTETTIAKQQRIKTGLMQDLLTRGIDEQGKIRSEETHEFKDSPLGRIPVEWEVKSLGHVIGPIVSGWSPTCDSISAAPGEWAILKTTAVVWSGYDQNENKRLPLSLKGIGSITVRKDDILITRKGPVDRVGVVVHVNETLPLQMIPDTVFRTRLLDHADIAPIFMPLALGCHAVQSDWFQKKIGLADAQVNLNHTILRSTLFPKPIYREQIQIVDRVNATNKNLERLQKSLAKLHVLKTALMQDLLTGKVRVPLDD